MKILVLQLARLGDIYQTWPTLRALRRKYPDAQLHLLVREKFFSATEGLDGLDKIYKIENTKILGPFFTATSSEGEDARVTGAVENLNSLIDKLREEKYDQIINLSFSPASSYLTDAVSFEHTNVSGFTRYSDGYFSIPDDASSYFYAQVGPQKSNRIHLTDILGLVAGVELQDNDFAPPEAQSLSEDSVLKDINFSSPYMVIHAGASEEHKIYSKQTLQLIYDNISKWYSGNIIFIGAPNEADRTPSRNLKKNIIDLVGKTKIVDVFHILKNADALVGCDSVAIHMASLTQTPTLNLTFPTVKFWETGPRARQSRILWFENNKAIDPVKVSVELKKMLSGEKSGKLVINKISESGVLYDAEMSKEDDFAWELTKALYLGEAFPVSDSNVTLMGFARLKELAQLGLEQIDELGRTPNSTTANEILNQIDGLMLQITNLAPALSPICKWFQAEKIRIAPGEYNMVLLATRSLYEKLRDICHMYKVNFSFHETMHREDLTWKS